jgi:plasmid stabilization system protein ParE
MKVVFLRSTQNDILWMRTYYNRVFPEGSAHARKQFEIARRMLAANPSLGRATEFALTRELQVARTPFSLIYRQRPGRIEVIRVWDGRADRSVINLE